MQKKLTSIVLSVVLLAITVKPVKANPAVIAPISICAGTAGIGCILIGTAVVGGVVYYVWQMSDGSRFLSDVKDWRDNNNPQNPEDAISSTNGNYGSREYIRRDDGTFEEVTRTPTGKPKKQGN